MIPHLSPIAARVRFPDARYFLLHLKCADGTATEADKAELDLMQAEKVAEYERDMGDCRSGTGAGREPSPSGLRPTGDHRTIAEINRGAALPNKRAATNQ